MSNSYKCKDAEEIKNFANSAKLKITKNSIIIPNEDHTLLNPLRYVIQRNNKNVELVGYSIPYPAEKYAELKFQYDKTSTDIKEIVCRGLQDLEDVALNLLQKIDECEN